MLIQPALPAEYEGLATEELIARVFRAKRDLGSRLVILGHHYQQDEVIRFADHVGDSLKLSQLAAQAHDAEFVVFCGVHFMAESADILTDAKVVILPDLGAGCSMADMANLEQVTEAWERITTATDQAITPITYVNSTAAIKAFCGEHGGLCCTSSNARAILEAALKRGGKVLFLPDQHLGRNTAYAMGFPLESMVIYDPQADHGGLSDAQIQQARFLLWSGHCSVHQMFTVADCQFVRKNDPTCRIIVHPECAWEVVQQADQSGSTEQIIQAIADSPDGSRWAVGTEINLVNRLAQRFAARKQVRSLGRLQCLCTTMYRIDLQHLAWCLDELAAGRIVNRIQVDPQSKQFARLALQRMLNPSLLGTCG